MLIVGKSFFSEILSKFNIKSVAPLCFIQIPKIMLARKEGSLKTFNFLDTGYTNQPRANVKQIMHGNGAI